MTAKKDTLELWNSVEKTDPKHTKEVKFGRKFTAIDPYHQLKAATKAFGPAGEGFGWMVSRVDYTTTNEIAILVRLWHGDRENWIEQWGQASLYIDNAEKKKDGDCFKKATTDGITKCLSCLGFNADVFLGMFEDNKYVAQVNQEFREEEKPQIGDTAFLKGVKTGVDNAVADLDLKKLVSLYKTNEIRAGKLAEDRQPEWQALFANAKAEINEKSA
jgi:hypothetical protein